MIDDIDNTWLRRLGMAIRNMCIVLLFVVLFISSIQDTSNEEKLM